MVKLDELGSEQVASLVSSIDADALCVHLNPAMELIQEDGDRDFTRGLETIARLVRDLPAGGKRFLQDATGYRATIVSGRVVSEGGRLTGEKPGRVARLR